MIVQELIRNHNFARDNPEVVLPPDIDINPMDNISDGESDQPDEHQNDDILIPWNTVTRRRKGSKAGSKTYDYIIK